MYYRTFLSWRYLVSRRTNLIGIAGIFVAVGALIMILSIMTGFLSESRKTIRGTLSDVVVAPIHLRNPHSGRVPPRDPERLLRLIRADERVEAASAHLVFFGVVIKDPDVFVERFANPRLGSNGVVQFVGIDVDEEFEATDFRRSLERDLLNGQPVVDPSDPFAEPPETPQWGVPHDRVIVGDALWKSLDLRRGDVVQLATIFPSPDDPETLIQNNREFIVAGSFRSGENEMDLERVYVERAALQDLLGGTREFSEILVRLRDYERDSQELVPEFRYAFSALGLLRGQPFEVMTWEDFRGPLLGAIENERVLMGIMLSLVLLVAGFTLFAILSMMVTEKTRDIGILTAIGATPRGVLFLFLWIAFWDSSLGAILGAVAGTWAAIEIDSIERWLSSTFGIQIFNRDVYLFDHIPSVVDPWAVAAIVLGAYACALLFAALPAWRAARTDPLQALRYE